MSKVRYVIDAKNPNIGFSPNEVLALSTYYGNDIDDIMFEFLNKAGKKSNVIERNISSVTEQVNMDNLLKTKLESHDISLKTKFKRIMCIETCKDYFTNEIFVFVNLDDKQLPVFIYSDGMKPNDRNFRDDSWSVIGLSKSKYTFVEYMNDATWRKFGDTLTEKIITYTWLFFLSPFWIPIWLYLKLKGGLKR